VTLLPIFLLANDLGWIDTYRALIFPALAYPVGVFMMRQFIQTIPSELEDAARIDGMSDFGIYVRVHSSALHSGFGRTGILYTFTTSWGAFLWPLIVATSDATRTIPPGLATIPGQYNTDWGLATAATVASMVPMLVIFLASNAICGKASLAAARRRGNTVAEVRIQRIVKAFGPVRAVNDVSLTIHDREFLVLLGPSGCGKTTLLRMIAGLEEPTAGEIYIDDQLVNFTPPKDRDIAMVFQNYALYPHMDVTRNISLGLKLHKTPRQIIKTRLDEAAEWLQLTPLLDRYPRQLSGGQQQRVALGRSVVREPKVFLMDEPLSNLDARLRVSMRTELIKLHRQLGATIVYVTHDQSEAMTMASRVAIMRGGVIQQLAPPLEVYRHPANKYVATFMGNPEMNFIEVTAERTGDAWRLVAPTVALPVSASAARCWQRTRAIISGWASGPRR